MNKDMFNALLASVEQADNLMQGKVKVARVTEFAEPEVKAIRAKTGLTQSRFADIVGVSKRTLENWEQGRRKPTGPARALLKILDADPKYALEALHGQFTINIIPKDNYILHITDENNQSGLFDVAPYLNSEVFSQLKEQDNFKRIYNGKYYIEWDCGADLSADTIEAKWKKS